MSYGIPSSLNYNLIPSSIGEEMSQAISFPSSDLLETINNYDQIDSYFVDCQLNPIDRVYGWSTTRGTCKPSVFFSNASQVYVGTSLSGTTAATDSTAWFQHTFVSGIVGSFAQHLIPIKYQMYHY